MNKEKVFELIKEATKELLHTDIIIYPEGSICKEGQQNINGLPYREISNDKPEFTDIRDYRKSLLELISKLIDFYKEV